MCSLEPISLTASVEVRLLAHWEQLSQGSKTASHRRYQMSYSSLYIPDHLCACPTYTYIQHISHIHAYIQHIAHTSTCTDMYIQHITHKHMYKCMHEHTETYITHLTCTRIHNTSGTLTCTHAIKHISTHAHTLLSENNYPGYRRVYTTVNGKAWCVGNSRQWKENLQKRDLSAQLARGQLHAYLIPETHMCMHPISAQLRRGWA